jgi:hypothetical protein
VLGIGVGFYLGWALHFLVPKPAGKEELVDAGTRFLMLHFGLIGWAIGTVLDNKSLHCGGTKDLDEGAKTRYKSFCVPGQVLALLGNSGNSDAPHLHFHLMDANSPVGAEGIPYELDSFTQLGKANGGPEILDSGQAWQPKSGEAPRSLRHEFPVDNAVVAFPSE